MYSSNGVMIFVGPLPPPASRYAVDVVGDREVVIEDIEAETPGGQKPLHVQLRSAINVEQACTKYSKRDSRLSFTAPFVSQVPPQCSNSIAIPMQAQPAAAAEAGDRELLSEMYGYEVVQGMMSTADGSAAEAQAAQEPSSRSNGQQSVQPAFQAPEVAQPSQTACSNDHSSNGGAPSPQQCNGHTSTSPAAAARPAAPAKPAATTPSQAPAAKPAQAPAPAPAAATATPTPAKPPTTTAPTATTAPTQCPAPIQPPGGGAGNMSLCGPGSAQQGPQEIGEAPSIDCTGLALALSSKATKVWAAVCGRVSV